MSQPFKYKCSRCGAKNDFWEKRCPVCDRMGSMVPEHFIIDKRPSNSKFDNLISRVAEIGDTMIPRKKTGIESVDRLFGGEEDSGIPEGFVIQSVGEPGIGKSTFWIMVACALYKNSLYITSEEAIERIGRKARKCRFPNSGELQVGSIVDLTEVKAAIAMSKADFIVIDSLQGLRLHSAKEQKPTEVKPMVQAKHTQRTVRDIAFNLISMARRRKVTIVLIGHVTKQGDLAGLKEIEHMVDAVSYFERVGDETSVYRSLRCSKNREADTHTMIWFEMTGHGLKPCPKPREAEKRKPSDDMEDELRSAREKRRFVIE